MILTLTQLIAWMSRWEVSEVRWKLQETPKGKARDRSHSNRNEEAVEGLTSLSFCSITFSLGGWRIQGSRAHEEVGDGFLGGVCFLEHYFLLPGFRARKLWFQWKVWPPRAASAHPAHPPEIPHARLYPLRSRCVPAQRAAPGFCAQRVLPTAVCVWAAKTIVGKLPLCSRARSTGPWASLRKHGFKGRFIKDSWQGAQNAKG